MTTPAAAEPINPYLDLLKRSIAAAARGEDNFVAEIDERFDIRVRVIGDTWDSRIDARVARFVLELQAVFDRIQADFYDYQVPENARLLIKVQQTEGSAKLYAEVGKLLSGMVNNLTKTQKALLIGCALAAVTGYFTTSLVLDYKKEVEEKVSDERTKQQLIELLGRQQAITADYEKPLRSLVHSMATDDQIELPSTPTPLTKEEAKRLFPRSPRTVPKTDYFDGRYTVKDITFDEPVVVTLERDGHLFRADISLSPAELDHFYTEIKRQQMTAGSDVQADLQVTARYSASGIREASVVGIGTARPASINVASVYPK